MRIGATIPIAGPGAFDLGAGFTDVVTDVDWSVEDGGRRALEMARDAGF
ncbi:MAG TPA: hypothetical protein VM848_09175 [Acidimicrobiia bacterium]|nr:hypothetical protein [Acidimicrobiia bacterium]